MISLAKKFLYWSCGLNRARRQSEQADGIFQSVMGRNNDLTYLQDTPPRMKGCA